MALKTTPVTNPIRTSRDARNENNFPKIKNVLRYISKLCFENSPEKASFGMIKLIPMPCCIYIIDSFIITIIIKSSFNFLNDHKLTCVPCSLGETNFDNLPRTHPRPSATPNPQIQP